MTSLLAAYVVVAVVVGITIGAIGLVLLTTHDIRKTIKRGSSDR